MSLEFFLFLSMLHLGLGVEIKLLKTKHNEDKNVHKRENAPYQQQAKLIPIEFLNEDYSNRDVPSVALVRPLKEHEISAAVDSNPLLATLLLSYNLHIKPKAPRFNHPQHLPINPYIALLLSHYGRYIPTQGRGHGIYGYTASNNYHNNLPFGAYKIYEDVDV